MVKGLSGRGGILHPGIVKLSPRLTSQVMGAKVRILHPNPCRKPNIENSSSANFQDVPYSKSAPRKFRGKLWGRVYTSDKENRNQAAENCYVKARGMTPGVLLKCVLPVR